MFWRNPFCVLALLFVTLQKRGGNTWADTSVAFLSWTFRAENRGIACWWLWCIRVAATRLGYCFSSFSSLFWGRIPMVRRVCVTFQHVATRFQLLFWTRNLGSWYSGSPDRSIWSWLDPDALSISQHFTTTAAHFADQGHLYSHV